MDIEVTMTFRMDERTTRLFLQSSIERVINTSIRLVDTVNDEDRDVNIEDWKEWKPVIYTIWARMHDAIFRKLRNMAPNETVIVLRRGDI